jgi:tetratricopeptide (TPR) repeat protein
VEAYTLLRERYPRSPFVDQSVLPLAEAEIETGRARDARQALEAFVAASPGDPRAPRALVLLARAREATGDTQGALDAYSRAAAGGREAEWSTDAVAHHARLLTQAQRWAEARTVLERLVRSQDPAVAARGARGIGEAYEAEGDRQSAIEWEMTAAYAAPDSDEGRRALLSAARSYAALNQPDAAAIVYRKLLAQPNLPAALASAARQGLATIKR